MGGRKGKSALLTHPGFFSLNNSPDRFLHQPHLSEGTDQDLASKEEGLLIVFANILKGKKEEEAAFIGTALV